MTLDPALPASRGTEATPREGVVLADNLPVLKGLPSGSIDLVYIDPPFGTGQVRRLDSIRTGIGTKRRSGFGGRTYAFDVVSTHRYRDDMTLDEYLRFLEERLVEMHRVLRPSGSLYLHLDFHAVHYARLMLDEIFGAERFLNEIIWAYDYGGRPKDRWPRKHDNILWYARSARWTFNRDAVNRIPYLAPGLVGPEKATRGKLPTDTWWMTIVPTNSRERTGYPTQKPVKLLERIVQASSNPGDLVADFFCGSGTTGVAAKRLGRRFLLVDDNPDAVQITRRRLAELDAADPTPRADPPLALHQDHGYGAAAKARTEGKRRGGAFPSSGAAGDAPWSSAADASGSVGSQHPRWPSVGSVGPTLPVDDREGLS